MLVQPTRSSGLQTARRFLPHKRIGLKVEGITRNFKSYPEPDKPLNEQSKVGKSVFDKL